MAGTDSAGAGGVGVKDWREALQAVSRSWQAIQESEEAQALIGNAVLAFQALLASWQDVSQTEEFQAMLAVGLEGFRQVMASWESVSQSEDFAALKSSVLPAGLGTARQAGGSLIEALFNLLEDRAILKSWETISQSEQFQSLLRTALPAGRAFMESQLGQAKGPLFQEVTSFVADRAGGLLRSAAG